MHAMASDIRAELLALGSSQRRPERTGGFEQGEGALHIGVDEGAGPVDAAIDVAFSREVHHGARLVRGEQPIEQRAVGDVAVHKDMARIAVKRTQAFQIARVGQRIEVEHRLVGLGQPVEHEVGADEAGSACDKDHGGACGEWWGAADTSGGPKF